MQKGMMLLYANDYRGSITQFQRAIKEYPGYYEAYAEMGVADMYSSAMQPAPRKRCENPST